MSEEDPLVDGVLLSTLKVVDLRAELKKRGLSGSGNKKELAERLKAFILQGAAEYSDNSAHGSPVKSPQPSNSFIAQYRASQQQMLAEVNRPEDNVTDTNGNRDSTSPKKGVKEEEVKEPSPEKPAEPTKEPVKDEVFEKITVQEPVQPLVAAEEPAIQKSEAVDKVSTESTAEDIKVTEESIKVEEKHDVGTAQANQTRADEDINLPGVSQEASHEISQEPADRSRDGSVNQVSGAENDESSAHSSPDRKSPLPSITSPSKINGSAKMSSEVPEELDYDDDTNIKPKKEPEVYTEGIVYVKSPEPPKKVSKVSPVATEALTEDGFIRRHEASPAKNEESVYIHVKNLKRPFTLPSLYAVLKKYGEFDTESDFWIDAIRSHCLVKFAEVEQAIKARNALHRVEWPPGNMTEISVDFTDADEFDKFRGVIKKVVKNRSPSPVPENVTPPVEEEKEEKTQKRKQNFESKYEFYDLAESKSMNELFRKTTTEPMIYYLPLNDEEAARNQAKKAIERREKKMSPRSPSVNSKRRAISPRNRSRSPDRKRERKDSGPRRRSPVSPPKRKSSDSPPPKRRSSNSPPLKRVSPSPVPKRRSPDSPPSVRRSIGSPVPKRRSRSPPPRRRSPGPSKRRSPASPPPKRRYSPRRRSISPRRR
uniref:SAP domain-containing protein n=1 Tax=Panagrolaimus sp. JU765 TaxID=591449 RepID=A0AC34RK24_9BILA